ncbi:hypothetical protein Gotri_000402 [Gossypium trilobum]|uniref:Uncharacterized protein n=1 Tax=Gossypium trilobum TaxID=34281 RepID=A0A7J9FD79_9ROSI|nr:hypothetical protein [Gossypium trilobum]
MTAEEAKILDHFFCETCSSKGQKKLQNSHAASRPSDTKVFPIPRPSIHFRVSPNSSAGMYYKLQTSPLVHYVSGGYKTTPEVTKRDALDILGFLQASNTALLISLFAWLESPWFLGSLA